MDFTSKRTSKRPTNVRLTDGLAVYREIREKNLLKFHPLVTAKFYTLGDSEKMIEIREHGFQTGLHPSPTDVVVILIHIAQ